MTGDPSWRIERACLNAWPALSSTIHDGWVIRLSNGLSRRANSVNPLHPAATVTAENLRYFEAVFAANGFPLIVRVPGLLQVSVNGSVEGTLAQAGFTREGECLVLHGGFDAIDAAADSAVTITRAPSPDWFRVMHALQNRTAQQAATYEAMIAALAIPAGFAVLHADGDPVALAYGALDGDVVCLESVITRASSRNRGYGRRLVRALLQWAHDNAARRVCLQVEAGNDAAIALYRRLGIGDELYRYHYLRAPSR